MSRTPGLWCLVDVRTTAILQDQILKTNPCAPGAEVAKTRRRKFGGKTLLENCDDPACGFDRGKDFISILGGMVVVATIFGILNSMPIFIPYASIEYEAGYIELNLIWATSLLVFNITSGISSPIIEYAGHRLTALFGMLFVFVGVLLDSQVFHIAVLWVGYVVLVGIGGGLAYSASFCLPADLFRKKLVLGCTPDENGGEENKSAKIRECVYKTVKTKKQEDECEHERHCLCVCVCDMRLFTDKSFLLWASLFMIATVNFGVPYMAFVSYAETVGAPISAWYITSYSIASVALDVGWLQIPTLLSFSTELFSRFA
ncbi:Monocarboxylate transporter 8 [Orchesella cincta]|uniref:Monocarboxylate transporter 8 n=1 Tax=Orchesella cincta TaxID=48709 RepID=A0A1D2NKL9_ORCCI|nr:Monocarboxylate transporter 8 [Orchesella cincta]